MILVAVAIAAAQPAPVAQPPVQPIAEATHAVEAGRLEQARIMIANAVKAGATGPAVDRVMADLSYASGDYAKALPTYLRALVGNSGDAILYERAGMSALRVSDMGQAAPLLERATSFPNATWRAWNGRGVAADYRRDWAVADESYARAAALAPQRAEIFNNAGWSLLVRGRWDEALGKLEQAASLDPKSARIAQNLELARSAVSEALPARRAGETDTDWAARLNDAGVIAKVQGDNKKAAAAFAQAVEIRSQYYERAANNLAQVERAR
jgi:Flp pilus assembly protein TadD